MDNQRSHYENLKVTRDAPIEVIRAAYRSLSQKYHPDRNNGNEAATDTMKLLNAAYETLTDLAKRQQYDAWIGADGNGPGGNLQGKHSAPEAMFANSGCRAWQIRPFRHACWYLLAIFGIWVMIHALDDPSASASPRLMAAPMIFETALSSPPFLRLVEAEKSGSVKPLTNNRSLLRPQYDVRVSIARADSQRDPSADKETRAMATRYDMYRVLEEL